MGNERTRAVIALVLTSHTDGGVRSWVLNMSLSGKLYPVDPAVVADDEDTAMRAITQLLSDVFEQHLRDMADDNDDGTERLVQPH